MVLLTRPTRANVSDEHDTLLKELAHPQRLRLLRLLARQDGTIHVEKLAQTLALTQPTVSSHLKGLTRAGFLTCQKCGQYHYYRINTLRLEDAINVIDGLLTKE